MTTTDKLNEIDLGLVNVAKRKVYDLLDDVDPDEVRWPGPVDHIILCLAGALDGALADWLAWHQDGECGFCKNG